jgi:hypothetical protein
MFALVVQAATPLLLVAKINDKAKQQVAVTPFFALSIPPSRPGLAVVVCCCPCLTIFILICNI